MTELSRVLDLWTPTLLSQLPPPERIKAWNTGVGSRETPEPICNVMSIFAAVTYSLGYGWRSGGAAGADEAFEEGVLTHPHYIPGTCLEDLTFRAYLPWDGFEPIPGGPVKKFQDFSKGYIDSTRLTKYRDAQELATFVHPMGDGIRERRGIWAMHTRNMFQSLGDDLQSPSYRLYCWAKPSKDGKSLQGGTRSAWEIAGKNRIPTINLFHDYPLTRTLEFLESYAKKLQQTAQQ
jgi:hypothetical protein